MKHYLVDTLVKNGAAKNNLAALKLIEQKKVQVNGNVVDYPYSMVNGNEDIKVKSE